MLDPSPGICESQKYERKLSDNTVHRTSPWNGMYSSMKGALHLMTDALGTECSFLDKNIKVMLVVPGAVKSNIAKNASGYEVPPDSMFKNFTQIIHQRIAVSQGPKSMNAGDFSRQVVSQVLNKNPPAYITLGGFSTVAAVVQWLPRFLLRWALGRIFNKPNQP
jgi:1-acylglycerone phosphate reductase